MGRENEKGARLDVRMEVDPGQIEAWKKPRWKQLPVHAARTTTNCRRPIKPSPHGSF